MEPTEMTNATDTICAISTAPGVGGIAVARISGPQAIAVADAVFSGRSRLADTPGATARFGTVSDSEGRPLDQAVATVFRAPRSYTGEDTVELSVHGSRYVQRELLASLQKAGARMAEAGEFTRRAFTSGKMDLAEAEAVADVIASNSRAAHRIALSQMRGGVSQRLAALRAALLDLSSLMELELDFSEEEVEFASREKLLEIARGIETETTRLASTFRTGAAVREGIPVAIVGATNAGKSSLLNALLGDNRAIVSDIHGTTRDTVEELMPLGDYIFRFIDTAGLRHTSDAIETIGINRSYEAASRAQIILAVTDPTQPLSRAALDDLTNRINHSETNLPGEDPTIIALINKTDIASADDITQAETYITSHLPTTPVLTISTVSGEGLDNLRRQLTATAEHNCGNASEDTLITNARHARALQDATASTARIIDGLRSGLSGDFIAQDIRETLHHLGTITGAITTPEILSTVFSRFCIGK